MKTAIIGAGNMVVKTLREQQMKEGPGDYTFLRTTDRQLALTFVCSVVTWQRWRFAS